MTQAHVDLLIDALYCDSDSKYICDRINFVTEYNSDYYLDCEVEASVRELINKWLEENGGYIEQEYLKFSFDFTQYAKDGMTREEWVETILVPLALKLPEEK